MSNQPATIKIKDEKPNEGIEDMVKRIFAIAQLIANSDIYHDSPVDEQIPLSKTQNHTSDVS